MASSALLNFFGDPTHEQEAQLRTEFDLEDGEKFIQDFACAMDSRVLLQGRVYIFEKHVAFHSVVFGHVTRVCIAFDNITVIRKAKKAIIFPNTIEVSMQDGRCYRFTSFLWREECYKIMCQQWIQNSGYAKLFLGEEAEKIESSMNKSSGAMRVHDRRENVPTASEKKQDELRSKLWSNSISRESNNQDPHADSQSDNVEATGGKVLKEPNSSSGSSLLSVVSRVDEKIATISDGKLAQESTGVRKKIESGENGADTTLGTAQENYEGSLRLEDLISEKADDVDDNADDADDTIEADAAETVRKEASALELATPVASAFQTQSRNIITPHKSTKELHTAKLPLSVQEFFIRFVATTDFEKSFRESRKDWDISVTEWAPQVLGDHIRQISYSIPLKQAFGPRYTRVLETQSYQWQSQDGTEIYSTENGETIPKFAKLFIQSRSTMLDIPFGDYFHCESYKEVSPNPPEGEEYQGSSAIDGAGTSTQDEDSSIPSCSVSMSCAVVFSKNTFWRGKIEEATFANTKKAFIQWTSFARQWYTNDINDKVVNGKLEEDSEGRSEDSRKIEDDRMSTRSNNSMVDQNAVISELLDKLGNEEIPPEQQRLIRRMLNLPGTDGDGKPSMVRAWHFTQTLVAAFLAIIIQTAVIFRSSRVDFLCLICILSFFYQSYLLSSQLRVLTEIKTQNEDLYSLLHLRPGNFSA